MLHFITIPHREKYELVNVVVPVCCVKGSKSQFSGDQDGLCAVDITVNKGRIAKIQPTSESAVHHDAVVDCKGSLCWPTFVDLHTHIDKGHTCERSRNPTGNLSGADRSTAADADFWDAEDVFRRMDFSLRCAYAHGTAAVRTHLINMTQKQTDLTWPVFAQLRDKWAGKVELQGVALVVLSYFRDREAATRLADTVAQYGGVLGAAVCCAENGGDPQDDWTTCNRDRDELLDFIFTLAKDRDLDLDFHTDENGNELARGLRYVALKAIQHGYQGRVVCGHCCSLAFQTPEDLDRTLQLVRQAGITVVSLPLVNEWTQDRDPHARRTPRWRGITTLHELRAAGVATAIASDNTRDQFYAYGDLDLLEVFTQAVRIGQLDRPYSDWPCSVTSVPAAAMKLEGVGVLAEGGPADMVLFRARKYSELLSRPQVDRVVVRNGRTIQARLPDYTELDYEPVSRSYLHPLPSTSACGTPRSLDTSEISLQAVSADSAHTGKAWGVSGGRGSLEVAARQVGLGGGGEEVAQRRAMPVLLAASAVVLAAVLFQSYWLA